MYIFSVRDITVFLHVGEIDNTVLGTILKSKISKKSMGKNMHSVDHERDTCLQVFISEIMKQEGKVPPCLTSVGNVHAERFKFSTPWA